MVDSDSDVSKPALNVAIGAAGRQSNMGGCQYGSSITHSRCAHGRGVPAVSAVETGENQLPREATFLGLRRACGSCGTLGCSIITVESYSLTP